MGDAAICKALLEKTLAEITDTHCTTIGGYAFYKFYDLRKAIFENATRIEQYAFAYCSKLETVEIPLAENVGYFSFYECTKLKKADFPNVKSVNRYAFNGSTALETLVLRSTTMATLLDVNALVDTRIEDGKGYIYVPSALIDSYKADSKWSTYANQFRVLEYYTVDGTITGELDTNRCIVRFFNGDTLLQTVSVPYGEIPVYTGEEIVPEVDYAFVGWVPEIAAVTGDVDYVAKFKFTKSITRSILDGTIKEYSDETVTSVGNYAFYYCNELVSVNVPSAQTIGSKAFENCSALTSTDISSATKIDGGAFEKCSKIAGVRLPSTPPKLGSNVFKNINSACVFYIPTGSLATYQSDKYWSSLTSTYSFVEEDR
jgi:hypothetical protein